MAAITGPAGVGGAPPPPGQPGQVGGAAAGAGVFAAELAQAVARATPRATGGLHVSGHAAQRLAQAGLDPDPQAWAEVGAAVNRAAAKGSRQTLVLWDRCALVVAVPERTVVTALAPERMRDHVFTGIDSAVFVTHA